MIGHSQVAEYDSVASTSSAFIPEQGMNYIAPSRHSRGQPQG